MTSDFPPEDPLGIFEATDVEVLFAKMGSFFGRIWGILGIPLPSESAIEPGQGELSSENMLFLPQR
jgi:hypothetical protein